MSRAASIRWLSSLALCAGLALACQPDPSAVGHQNFTSPQSNPIAVSKDGRRVYVANTTSNSVSVIDAHRRKVVAEIPVGLEPVSVEVRPDGHEVWVSNHVSDSVSVIDTRRRSPTRHTVTHTIQDLDANGVTRFDEPVGIAFQSGKAYVALSSRNDIAVVDPGTYQVISRIHIDAQEPRAITARDGRLYVVAFESMNQSQISGCTAYDPPQCTLTAQEVGDFILEPNLPGVVKNIVIDPLVPDRDLFVIDTATDTVVEVVEHVGTLLYGVAVDSQHNVYVSQTDARNAENGLEVDDLPALENRMFDNQIGVVPCGGSCGVPQVIALDPPLPSQPLPSEALATPYGIRVSDDDSTLFVTAMGTSRLFSVDTASGVVLDRLDLGPNGQEIPKGVALRRDQRGRPDTAWVLNTLDNSVAVVDVSDPSALALIDEIPVGDDPTPETVRKGRIAFMNAFGSDSATFSCESCHPDGNTDQLLWAIGGACFFGECSGHDEPRTTMPVRGLSGTLPLHWDGTLGDPIGGRNGATGPDGDDPPQCTDDHSCFRHLVDASMAGVMCEQTPSCATGPSGLPGPFGEEERENMAFFLASVAYPPARSRAMDDVLSDSAVEGFEDFFVDQGGLGAVIPGRAGISSCGDMDNGCHELPLFTSTNTNTLQGFDAPTMRGMTDRFVQFSLGLSSSRAALEEAALGVPIPFLGIQLVAPPSPLPWDPAEGFEEDVVFAAAFNAFDGIYNVGPLDIFQMIEEMSTGTSGAIGRQVTVGPESTDPANLAGTLALMGALEAADVRGVVNLQATGRWLPIPVPARFTYQELEGGGYGYVGPEGEALSGDDLVTLASAGHLVVTLTAHLPPEYGRQPQPLLRPATNDFGVIGSPDLPRVPEDNPFALQGHHVGKDARLFVNGEPAEGSVGCVNGEFSPWCDSNLIRVTLQSPPTTPDGIHTLQVQNPGGPLSNEMPLCRASTVEECR